VLLFPAVDQTLSLQMMQMITGGIVAQCVGVAAELGIADLLADKPQTTAQLAAVTKVESDKLYRLLRFLASLGIFQLSTDGNWSLTPLAGVLRSDVAGSVRAGARMMGRTSRVTPHLLKNIRTGQSAYSLTFGKTLFEDLGAKPEDAAIFDAAMTSFHGGETTAVLDAYNYDGVSTLADIGCGNGDVMATTLQRYPAMRGILFDQAHVMERTAIAVKAAGVADRCTLQSGSFFESVAPGADCYSMRHILHDWSDELCIRILGNIRKVIPASGRLLILETVVPDGNEPSPSKLFDILMMMYPDGMERSEAQFQSLFAASGFRLAGITPTKSPVSVIEARPV
jgi:hypothetical protein